jgi:GT2 family glycosyltransferase/glycosyltransferase involved in cell wall biosynthesis
VPRIVSFQLEQGPACPEIRVCAPLRHLAANSDWEFSYGVERLSERGFKINFEGADVALFQRHFKLKDRSRIFRHLLQNQVPIIFEIDDDFFNVPMGHEQKEVLKILQPVVNELLALSDVVTVTNEELKRIYQPYCKQIEIIPNTVDPELWNRERRWSEDEKIIIGFSGTNTHQDDITMMQEALLRILDEYPQCEMHFWGCSTKRMEEHERTFLHNAQQKPYREYATDFQAHALDIAIAPLIDNDFNRCKSAIKWKEYGIGSVPGVFSRLPAYERVVEEGFNGYLAGPDPEEWYQHLKTLVEDKKLRQQMGEKSREKILREYSVKQSADKWQALLDSLQQAKNKKEKQDPPQVSIIIPLYNRSDLTKNCLESIFNTPGPVSYEVIVLNNASEDDTLEILEKFKDKIRLINCHENYGFSIANNMGADIALGDKLVMLNNDTTVRPNWLEALVNCQKETGASLIGARLYYPDGRIQHCGVALFPHDNKPHALYAGLPGDHPDIENLTGIRRAFQIVTAACWLVTRDCWDALGGFNTDYINGYEDVDFCLRLNESGGRVFYEPLCQITHFESQSPGRGKHSSHNEKLLFSKWQKKWVHDLEYYNAEDGVSFNPEKGYEARANNDIFAANFEALKQKNEVLANQIFFHREGWLRRRCQVIENKTVKISKEERQITLHSKRAPAEEGKRLAEKYLSENPGETPLQILGFGFGWHVQALLEIAPESRKIEIRVLDPLIFRLALENRDLRQMLKNPRLTFVSQIGESPMILPAYAQLLT